MFQLAHVNKCQVEEDRVDSDSMRLVLRHESMLYMRLLSTVQQTLENLRDALMGHAEMSEDLQLLGLQVEKGHVPFSWKKMSFPSCKTLAPYIDDLVKRLDYLEVTIITAIHDRKPQFQIWKKVSFLSSKTLAPHIDLVDSLDQQFPASSQLATGLRKLAETQEIIYYCRYLLSSVV